MNTHSGKTLYKKRDLRVIDCNKCGYAHVVPLPTTRELKTFYRTQFYNGKPEYISKWESELEYWNLTYEEKYQLFDKYKKSRGERILEVGCSAGFFLKYGKKIGWNVLGIEPAIHAYDYAKNLGINVINSTYEEIDNDALDNFDVIYSAYVLEHLPNPQNFIKKSWELLKRGGLLVTEIPNDFNPLQELYLKSIKNEPYWVSVKPPLEHLNYFNVSSFSKLLSKNKFDAVYFTSTYPLEFFLLMNENYVGNDTVGRGIHIKRMEFEKKFHKFGYAHLKRQIYDLFAQMGIGREMLVFGRKR